VEQWTARRAEIEKELERVWVQGGDELGPPSYAETVHARRSAVEGSGASESSPVDDDVDDDAIDSNGGAESAQGEGLSGSSSTSTSWNPALRPS
jgi:ATP-binding cassette subfamily D (ALD) long-chain fatty acid import protein